MRRLSLAIAFCFPLAASAQLSPDTEKAIDAMVAQQLAASGEPSVSIAVAVDGKLAYAKAFGHAQLNPKLLKPRCRCATRSARSANNSSRPPCCCWPKTASSRWTTRSPHSSRS
ncbi:hypothetical protein LP420_10310 [Massilia sp. B-10]|nr:hypothetical protein LP420_10310 [Massilia sp. B-10]